MRLFLDKAKPFLAGLTTASLLSVLPVLQFLEANPYFAFRYGFDQTLLFLVLVLFGAVPWIAFSFLFANTTRPWLSRLAHGLVLVLFFSQLHSTTLSAASPWLGYGIPLVGIFVGAGILARRDHNLVAVLALVSCVAVPFVAYQIGEHWWRIPKQPDEPIVAPSELPRASDVYVFFLDGSTLTAEYLDAAHYPDRQAFPNLHRFVREDAHWFYNAVSNGPGTAMSAPSIFTGKLYASRLNNLLANEETIFTVLRSRFEVRAYLHTKGYFCVGRNFELCYPFESQSYVAPLRVLSSSLAYISSFRLTPLGYPVGAFNASAYSRDEFVGDFLHRQVDRSGKPHFYTIQLFDRGLEGLREFDALLGGFLSTLEHQGRYDESIIVLLSDHGLIRNGERFTYGPEAEQKPELYRVPFAIKPPGRGHGRAYDYVAQGIDIVPTLLALILPETEYAARSYDGVNLLESRPQREHYINMFVPGTLFKFAARPDSGLVAVPLDETGY